MMREAGDPIVGEDVDSLRQLQLDQKKKKTRALLVTFVALPLLLAVIGGGWWYLSQQAATEDIATAWSQASGCLVGQPLADGERASLRVRAVQLTAVHSERDAEQETQWPSRCADAFAELYEALRKHGRHKETDGLAARVEPFTVALRKAEVMKDLSKSIDGVFEAAAAIGLKAQPVSLQIPTPEPSPGFNLDTLPESARISDLQYTLDSVTGTPNLDNEIHALVYDKKVDPKPILCTFRPSGKDNCRELGGELIGRSGLALIGTVDEGATPLIMAGLRGSEGVYRSDGTFEKITAMEVQSAYVAADGYVAIAGYAKSRDEGEFDLVEQAAPNAPVKTRELRPSDWGNKTFQVNRTQLLWGKLIAQVIDGSRDDPTPRLTYVPLPLYEKIAPTVIGKIDWVNANIFGCRTDDTLAVGVGNRAGFITFFENDKWTKPVVIEAMAPAISCTKGELSFTGSYGGQERCTPAGCKFVPGVAPTFNPFKVRQAYWADLNGKILSVASTERRGGLRYRHSDGKNLSVAGADRVLFDDLVRDGAIQTDSTLLGLLLAGRGKYAVVLLTTPKGVYALRFDADGKPKPAKIK